MQDFIHLQLKVGGYYRPHRRDEEIEAQRGKRLAQGHTDQKKWRD